MKMKVIIVRNMILLFYKTNIVYEYYGTTGRRYGQPCTGEMLHLPVLNGGILRFCIRCVFALRAGRQYIGIIVQNDFLITFRANVSTFSGFFTGFVYFHNFLL